jgi:hypothetical protein
MTRMRCIGYPLTRGWLKGPPYDSRHTTSSGTLVDKCIDEAGGF